jgi:pimeloyl-ACP methyl ester carboxylesterase
MPTIEINGATLYYEEHGSGGETVVFAHGLLFDRRIFEEQVAALSGRYRVIAFDFRGHGGSEVTKGGYDMDTLAADAAGLIEALGAAPCHFAGLSMGGFVGLRLAARRPELVRSLAVLDSSADPEPRGNLPRYRLLQVVARLFGLGAVAGRVMPILLGRTTMEDPARREMRELWHARVVGQDRVGVTRAVSGVLERDGVYDELPGIRAPVLIVVGEEDTATPPAKAERMREAIPDAELVTIPRAGHMSSIEAPGEVTRAMEEFLARVG